MIHHNFFLRIKYKFIIIYPNRSGFPFKIKILTKFQNLRNTLLPKYKYFKKIKKLYLRMELTEKPGAKE